MDSQLYCLYEYLHVLTLKTCWTLFIKFPEIQCFRKSVLCPHGTKNPSWATLSNDNGVTVTCEIKPTDTKLHKI
jgi:hypothetical protein